jgi:hypothetical protein
MKRSSARNRLLPLDVAIVFDVARFLNEESALGEHADVLKIFELCRELEDCRDFTSASDLNEKARRATLKLDQLNAVLRKFEFVPFVHGLGPHHVTWIPAKGPAAEDAAIRAGSFVGRILEMTEAGTLGLVRRCICGQWFVAQTAKKLVCSDACRFRKFKQSDRSFNKDRAQYMREYRKTPAVIKRRKNRAKTKRRKAPTRQ